MSMNRIACAVLLSGVASAALSANPAEGMLSTDNRVLTYGAGPFAVGNQSASDTPADPACDAPLNTCDDFALTVDLPTDYAATHPRDLIRIVARWPLYVGTYNLHLVDADGNVIFSTLSGNDPIGLAVAAAPGAYAVRLVPVQPAGETVSVTVELLSDPTNAAGGEPPAFTVLPSPSGLGDNTNGEMNVGYNPATGSVMTLGFVQTLRTRFSDPIRSDEDVSWQDVSDPVSSSNTNDPILVTDQATGRTFVSQLQAGTPGESIFVYSDDDGDSWTLSPSTIDGGIDHQTLGGGPYSASGSAGPSGAYPNALYYCSQSIVAAFCVRSDDGGDTFGAPTVMKTSADCDGFIGSIHGHLKVANDGTVYVPDRNCGGDIGVAVSEDSGASFTMKRLPDWATAGEGDPSIALATDGTGYLCYVSSDSHVHVAVTRDKGDSWINDRDIGYAAGVKHAVFPQAVAGDPDRAACAFLGTTTQGNYQSTDFQGIWHAYIATTYDGGNSWHTQNVTPDDPVQGTGGICVAGTTCIENRNLLDFNEITRDEQGRILFAFNDGCVGDCTLEPYAPNQVCIPTFVSEDVCLNSTAKTTLIRQSGGRTLLAAYDGVPTASGRATPQGSGALGWASLLLLLMAAARKRS